MAIEKTEVLREFKKLNEGFIEIDASKGHVVIRSKIPAEALIYPEGWCWSKGTLTNKHISPSGFYTSIPIFEE